jgi:hypothetical protein
MNQPADLHIRLMLTEPTIAKLTEQAVTDVLDGFPLQPNQSMAWLARAIQGALYASLHNASDGPERQSNADTRKELEKLASRASELWLAIQQRSDAADSAAWDFAFRNWSGDGPMDGDPQAPWNRFNAALAQLEWLARFMRGAAEAQSSQAPKWRQTERREQRICRAQCLSPIYETAFGVEPTVNTWLGNDGGPWRDFYQRIVAFAFGEQATPDWEGVLDEARRRDRAQRVTFAPGVIPDIHP